MTEAAEVCPCGSTLAEAACCGPFLAGAAAPTAVALMRSRYTAYVRNRVDYVIATHDPETRDQLDQEATAQWARETTWKSLTILATQRGGPDDDEGLVEFVAEGTSAGKPLAHRELSRFRRADGRWYFVDGAAPRQEPLVKEASPGRNEPCPCGSGKKYKRCHG